MSIGDVRPREEDEDEDGPSISIRVNPSTSISNDQAQQIIQDSSNDDYQVQDQVGSSSAPSSSTQEPIIPQRIHHVLAKDHPVDQIMGDISVAKLASHAIFQYNVLAIDDTHNTWTNMIVKMTILRLLDSSDDKEKIGVARPE